MPDTKAEWQTVGGNTTLTLKMPMVISRELKNTAEPDE
jgi:hypothetical protein